jgi:RimJ/RimL family protein N-acetyltransferase
MSCTTAINGKQVLLRVFQLSDAADVKKLAGNRAVADNRLSIPYPYEDGMAEQWIASLGPRIDRGELASYAITKNPGGELVGAISLQIHREFDRAALSYWIGEPYWGLGYCTEAASLVVAHGFEKLRLNRIYATHVPQNPASGRVLQKIGMRLEGQQRQHRKNRGRYEDLVLYGLLREDWSRSATARVRQ